MIEKAQDEKQLLHEKQLRELYNQQKELLDTFLKNGAISQAQYNKSLGDMTEKMGMKNPQ